VSPGVSAKLSYLVYKTCVDGGYGAYVSRCHHHACFSYDVERLVHWESYVILSYTHTPGEMELLATGQAVCHAAFGRFWQSLSLHRAYVPSWGGRLAACSLIPSWAAAVHHVVPMLVPILGARGASPWSTRQSPLYPPNSPRRWGQVWGKCCGALGLDFAACRGLVACRRRCYNASEGELACVSRHMAAMVGCSTQLAGPFGV
jgi:hypothetical protein